MKNNFSEDEETRGSEEQEEQLLKDPHWVEKAIQKAVPFELTPNESNLANILIDSAFASAKKDNAAVGLYLAAAFDLFAAVEYYKRVTSRGWLYCPGEDPMLIYSFTNICTRCALKGDLHFHKANKPGSGTIGGITRKLLGIFLERLFNRSKKNLSVLRGAEPVDLIVLDKANKIALMAEAKAAPLTTLALAARSEKLTETDSNGSVIDRSHGPIDNAAVERSVLNLFLPQYRNSRWEYDLISLGIRAGQEPDSWAYVALPEAFKRDSRLFGRYFVFWKKAFEVYGRTDGSGKNPNPIYWLTNACGQPVPRPAKWPRRSSGGGYESVSDGKSSMGMDRTDDIKKGIYQVLKIGASAKPKRGIQVKTALLSNIHAIRHYEVYLRDMQDIVWTQTNLKHVTKAAQLPPEQDIYNLCDGIISFTQVHARDPWIENNFTF